jgi:acetyl esterase/lipase
LRFRAHRARPDADQLEHTMTLFRLTALASLGALSLALYQSPVGGGKKVTATDGKVYLLWPEGAPLAKGKAEADVPKITVYLPAADRATGAAVVVCPGGGYGGLAISYEGHDVARWLNTLGVAGIVLKYRVAPYRHPAPLLDAQRALRYTRAHAKEWGIDPKRVGILGFSAGGHLASTAATQFDTGKDKGTDPLDKESCRPDFAVLVYPVITLTGPFAHGGSRDNLLGKGADPQLIDSLCSQKRVTAQTPPTFLVHTTEDKAVPPENSILFYEALRRAKVPAEMHIYEKGRHGLGLGPKDMAFSSWPDRCAAWLKARKILTKE